MGNSTIRNDEPQRQTGNGIVAFVVRFVVAALVLLVASYIVPGFVLGGFFSALIAALVIAAVDYLIARIFGLHASPFGRGIVGFIVSAAIIYFAQYIVPSMAVSWFGAIIGALVIGAIDAIVPTKVM